MKLQRPDPGIDVAKSGLHGKAGLFFDAGVFEKGEPSFGIQDLDPYLLFDARESMLGTLENPTLDLDPATPSTLDVITATRSGTATYTDPDGNIATAAADTVRVDYTQGEELTPTKFQNFGQTEFDQWTKGPNTTVTANATEAPDGSMTGYRLHMNSPSGTFLRQVITVDSPTVFSVYVKASTESIAAGTNVLAMQVDLTYPTFTATEQWQRVSFVITGPLSNTIVGFNDDIVGHTDLYIWGPQLEEGTTASDFVANTTGSPKFLSSAVYSDRVPMILVEPSSENLWGWSEGTLNDYQTNAVLVGETYLSDDATSRNGLNSWLYFQPSSDTQVGFRMPVSVTSGSTMILSFYVIMDDGSKPRVGTSSTGSDTDFAILLQGISSAGVAGGVEHISGDLYRVWAYRVFTGTSNAQYIYRYATHSGKGFKISGVMLEESSVPTSYIPTSGSTVTRQADDLVISGSDFTDFYNSSEGTIYTESTGRGYFDFNTTFAFSDNSASNRIYARSTSNTGGLAVFSGGSTSASMGGLTVVANNVLSRSAHSFKANNFLSSRDGISATPDTSGNMPVGIDRLYIGAAQTGGNQLNGHLKRLIYWPYHSDSL